MLYFRNAILLRKLLEFVIEIFVAKFYFAQVFMRSKSAVRSFDYRHSYVGAMVRDPLEICQNIAQNEACLNGARPPLQASHMVSFDVTG